MDLLKEELKEVKKVVQKQIPNSTLETCVPAMVRVVINRGNQKCIVVCIQFPESYPNNSLMVEVKCKTASDKVLDGIGKLCQEEIKKYIGKPQVMKALHFISQFLDENPLCCYSIEISAIKKILDPDKDNIKLKQKSNSIVLNISDGPYMCSYNIRIPCEYPAKQVSIESKKCNYPPVLDVWFVSNATEIARRCVVPPLKRKPKDPPFSIKQSLLPVVKFLLEECHSTIQFECGVCEKSIFPEDPEGVEKDETKDDFIERIYCGHLYHYKCLDNYVNLPPFNGRKKCHVCGSSIYHDKFKITPKVAESRYCYEQAKQRELDDVKDAFL